LTTGAVIYPHRPDLHSKSFWQCDCGAYCGCHPGTTTALGSPCGPETRKARSAAHAAFDPYWKLGKMTRSAAYKRLADELGIKRADCHIGMMDAVTARRVVEVVTGHASSPSPSAGGVK
jgi:hypothetical protein